MTIAFWCVLVASVMPIAVSWVSGYYRQKQLGVVDNKYPRRQSAALTDAGERAVACQKNCWEALVVFGFAVVVAHLAGLPAEAAATPALIFVAARVVYIASYLANWDILRSLCFLVSYGASVALYIMAA